MKSTKHAGLLLLAFAMTHSSMLSAQEATTLSKSFQMHPRVTRAEVVDRTLKPFNGESRRGVGTFTLKGKVMCGYQGWFACPGDGSGRGWCYWRKRGEFRPGSCTIDLWPDVSELSAGERFTTDFLLADGSKAELYSPLVARTVQRHFRWMKDYGIDGVFVQRFGAEIRNAMGLYHFNTVLANCRAGANAHGRAWAVMYDLLTYEGLPSDHYLWLVGQGGRLIRGEIETSETLPKR